MNKLRLLESEATLCFRPREGEPEWLSAMRRRAWEAYEAAPLPERVQHLWRYSDPQRFLPRGEVFGEAPPLPEEAAPSPAVTGTFSGTAWSRDGVVVKTALSDEARKAGVLLCGLREGLEKNPALRGRLAAAVGAAHGKFEALNLASFRDGVLLHVPKGAVFHEPFHIHSSFGGDGAFVAVRVLVAAEENSEITVVDEYAASASATPLQLSAVAEVFAGPSSRLRYITAQNFSRPMEMFLTARMHAERDAAVLLAGAFMGSSLCKIDQGVRLAGQGAHSEVAGIVLGEKTEHVDYHTALEHSAPRTASNVDVKVALRGRARSSYTGLICIEPSAPYSDAYQENRNLLLNPGTKAESIPELEIQIDEVRCSHGATVSPVDPQQLFYLMCRGLSRREAAQAIVEGFFEKTLKRFPESVQEALRRRISRRLEN